LLKVEEVNPCDASIHLKTSMILNIDDDDDDDDDDVVVMVG
jgi:hypothetical protein